MLPDRSLLKEKTNGNAKIQLFRWDIWGIFKQFKDAHCLKITRHLGVIFKQRDFRIPNFQWNLVELKFEEEFLIIWFVMLDESATGKSFEKCWGQQQCLQFWDEAAAQATLQVVLSSQRDHSRRQKTFMECSKDDYHPKLERVTPFKNIIFTWLRVQKQEWVQQTVDKWVQKRVQNWVL